MAAKRITSSAVDWAKIAERIPEVQKLKFVAFRAKSDSYLRRMFANPENPPKIDWAFYKKTIPMAGLVDNFQKQYETVKIPFPADTVTSQVEAQEKDIVKAIEGFKKASNEKIKEYRAEAERIKGLLPYEEMTMEEYYEANPDQAIDTYNRPTLWPHFPEDQPGYKAPEGDEAPAKEGAAH